MVCALGPSAIRTSTRKSSIAGIEELLELGPQPVDLVDEEDIARAEAGEQADQVAGLLQDRTRRGPELDPHLLGEQRGERGLAQAGRPEEEDVVERLLPALGRVDGDLERGLEPGLADELVQPGRPERRLGAALVGQRGRRGDLEPAQSALAFQRTGRAPGVTSCFAWQVTQRSTVRVRSAGHVLAVGGAASGALPFGGDMRLLDTAIIRVLLVGW